MRPLRECPLLKNSLLIYRRGEEALEGAGSLELSCEKTHAHECRDYEKFQKRKEKNIKNPSSASVLTGLSYWTCNRRLLGDGFGSLVPNVDPNGNLQL